MAPERARRRDARRNRPVPTAVAARDEGRGQARRLPPQGRGEATYVGGRFAEEARSLHETGTEKAIWGEANAREVRGMLEDGIGIAPLPFMRRDKVN